jgi:hypothetical protein
VLFIFSKWAQSNILVKLVEPGFMITTNFMTSHDALNALKNYVNQVAEQVFNAACDKTDKLCNPAGPDAEKPIQIKWSHN